MRRAIGLLLVLACSGESTGPTRAEIAGTWMLQTIDGQPLPVRIDRGQPFPDYTDVIADSLILLEAGGIGNQERTRLYEFADPPGTVCCARNDSMTVTTDLGWSLGTGDSVVVTALYPAGYVDHPGVRSGDRLTFQLTQGTAWLPDGRYVYARAP